jgi:type I restriction enzyme S subunit
MEDVGKSIEIVNTNNERIVSGLHTLLARQLNEKLIIGFGGYLFKSDVLRKQIKNEAQGAKVLGISSGRLSKIRVCFPSDKAEQQKIAECLSSLDALIAAQTEKIDVLKTHKKGLMQRLFPREGETAPRLRFPDYRAAGKWEKKLLGEVVEYTNGKAHEQNIDEKGKYVVVNSKFISTKGEIKKYSNTANLLANKDDILMVLSDVPNGRAIGKCFYVDSEDTYIVNQRICKLTAKSASSILLFYILDRNSYFLAFDDGAKQTNLKKNDVLECPMHLPKDEKEQKKIADCLSSLDEMIVAQTKKLNILKTHKKGLMQQLFPSPETVGV